MPDARENLLELLLKNGVISNVQYRDISDIIAKSGKSVEAVLMAEKILNLEDIVKFKADIYKVPYKYLEEDDVGEDALNVIPSEVARNYSIVCFAKTDKQIKVGMIDPYNSRAVEAVNFLAKEAGLSVEYYLISEDSLKRIFNKYGNLEKEISSALETKAEAEAEKETVKEEESEEDIALAEGDIAGAPVARIVSVIIRHAVEKGASDIHIEPTQTETRVRYRIDGILQTSLVLPKNIHASVVGRIKVLAHLKLDETRIPQDGRIRLMINKSEVDFRVSTMPLMGSEKVVMRILNLEKGIPSLKDLGFSSVVLDIISKNIKKTFGLFLVTGPTGSGKSSTLASVLNMLNSEKVNIVTLEDPIEYHIKGINQSQVRPAIDYTFANGLRSILRQDPDIVMVGEIRDNETADLSINAGLTGHFVLSTLHTNNALDAIPRLVDMKVETFLLGSTLNTIVAQRLARRICLECKQEVRLEKNFLDAIKAELLEMPPAILQRRLSEISGFDINNLDQATFYEGKGCKHCNDTGYEGRMVIAEVIDINDKLKEIIMSGKHNLSREDVIKTQDFVTMKQDGIIKSLQGLTTIQEVLRIIQD